MDLVERLKTRVLVHFKFRKIQKRLLAIGASLIKKDVAAILYIEFIKYNRSLFE